VAASFASTLYTVLGAKGRAGVIRSGPTALWGVDPCDSSSFQSVRSAGPPPKILLPSDRSQSTMRCSLLMGRFQCVTR